MVVGHDGGLLMILLSGLFIGALILAFNSTVQSGGSDNWFDKAYRNPVVLVLVFLGYLVVRIVLG